MNKLAAYKLDKAFTEGVEIRLDGAPDVAFRVKLPSQYNRQYTQALYGSIDWNTGPDGTIKAGGGLLETRFATEDAFLSKCLVSMDGEPIPADFAQEYPAAVTELMEKATELANAIESKVADTAKKSLASSAGSESGPGESHSIESLNSATG